MAAITYSQVIGYIFNVWYFKSIKKNRYIFWNKNNDAMK